MLIITRGLVLCQLQKKLFVLPIYEMQTQLVNPVFLPNHPFLKVREDVLFIIFLTIERGLVQMIQQNRLNFPYTNCFLNQRTQLLGKSVCFQSFRGYSFYSVSILFFETSIRLVIAFEGNFCCNLNSQIKTKEIFHRQMLTHSDVECIMWK